MNTSQDTLWSQVVSPRGLLLAALTAAVFLVDLATPLGINVPVLYAIVVFIALELTRASPVVLGATLCSVLTLVALFASSEGENFKAGLINRALAFTVIWSTVVLGLQRQRIQREQLKLSEERQEGLSKALENFVPICAWCRKIRGEGDSWLSLEGYLQQRTGSAVTHGICPDCGSKLKKEAQVSS